VTRIPSCIEISFKFSALAHDTNSTLRFDHLARRVFAQQDLRINGKGLEKLEGILIRESESNEFLNSRISMRFEYISLIKSLLYSFLLYYYIVILLYSYIII